MGWVVVEDPRELPAEDRTDGRVLTTLNEGLNE